MPASARALAAFSFDTTSAPFAITTTPALCFLPRRFAYRRIMFSVTWGCCLLLLYACLRMRADDVPHLPHSHYPGRHYYNWVGSNRVHAQANGRSATARIAFDMDRTHVARSRAYARGATCGFGFVGCGCVSVGLFMRFMAWRDMRARWFATAACRCARARRDGSLLCRGADSAVLFFDAAISRARALPTFRNSTSILPSAFTRQRHPPRSARLLALRVISRARILGLRRALPF